MPIQLIYKKKKYLILKKKIELKKKEYFLNKNIICQIFHKIPELKMDHFQRYYQFKNQFLAFFFGY